MSRKRAGIQLADAWDAAAIEIIVERFLCAPVAELVAGLAHDQRREPGPPRLDILAGDAVVADEWVGQHDHLPAIGGIGADFLVASHAGGEDNLAAPPVLQ